MDLEERESLEHIKKVGAEYISKAHKLSKEGKTDDAYNTLLPLFEGNDMPTYFWQVAGWTIYRYLKAHIPSMLPENVNKTFGYYLNFCEHKPDMLHSMMMVLASEYAKKHGENFVDFCRSWGLDNFRDEDYVATSGKDRDGKPFTFQSLAVKTAVSLYKALKKPNNRSKAKEFLPFFENISKRCPDFEFTPLYIANITAWSGDREKAIAQFKDLLVNNPQWYLWKFLGDLLDGDLKVSCYSKALTMMDKEEYLGDLHLSMASILLPSNKPQAAYELNIYYKTYSSRGWHISFTAQDLSRELEGITPSSDGNCFYASNTALAEGFVYERFPKVELTFLGKKKKHIGKLRYVLSNKSRNIRITTPVTPELSHASIGDIYLCRLRNAEGRYRLLTVHPTGRKNPNVNHVQPKAKDGKIIEGVVRRRDGWAYAFINDCFANPSICERYSLRDGKSVKAKVVQKEDGKWRVVKILHN